MQVDMRGNVIAITGGASGIGEAVARECAASGATVVVLDVDVDAGKRLSDDAPGPGQIGFMQLDVTDRTAVHEVFNEIVEEHGRLDGLVSAAIIQPLVDLLEIDEEVWDRVFDVNVSGTLWAAQAALHHMAAQRSGSIVMFTSGVVNVGKPRSAPYVTSKGAIAALAKNMANEMASTGVKINTVRPGVVRTPMYESTNERESSAPIDGPEDIVGPIMYLLSDAATMTGSSVNREMPYWPVKAAQASE